jgi:DNA polymerase-3 subunit delta'
VSELKGLPEPELYTEEGTISIDMVRLLRKEAALRPYQEGKRVFLVLDAHRMKEEAQNAFLKLLEEPPADTIVILTTSRPDALSPTILSRCQRVRFSRLSTGEIEETLQRKLSVDTDRGHLIASLSGGSLGRAERMLEAFEEEHRSKIFDFTLKGSVRDDLDILDLAQELVNDGLVHRTLDVVQSIYRDMLAMKMGADGTVVNVDQKDLIRPASEDMTWEEIRGIIYEVEDAAGYLARNVNSRLVLFNLLEKIQGMSHTKV